MNITRTANLVNGKMVYDPPYTAAELESQAAEFAAMCQSRRAPMMKGSDRGLLEGDLIHHGLQMMPKPMQESHIIRARRAGINPHGKVYKSGLADQRGPADPDAWVSSADDILATCRKKNLSCHGIVNYEGRQVPEKPAVPLSERCIAEMAEKYVKEDPTWLRKPQELREMVVEKHGAPVKKERGKKSIAKMTQGFDRMASEIGSV